MFLSEGDDMKPDISLKELMPLDMTQVKTWLSDIEVNEMWYGCDDDGVPLHIGYDLTFNDDECESLYETIQSDKNRKILSIYNENDAHVGESQLVYEWPLLEAQLFLLIGEKNLWHHHLGTAALVKVLDYAFYENNLHRVWVDVPEYNVNALQMVDHLGFVMEGHFRGAHRKNGSWYDSSALGLLNDEYARRRNRIIETEL